MQLEFIDQHPSSTAVVFSGTQDNGTEQYRGTPVFYHADEGDGGYAIVNQSNPTNIVSTYYGASPKLSTQGGKFGTWTSVAMGIGGSDALFYPPMTACKTNTNALALGTTVVNIDPAQGASHWTTQVALPGLAVGELVTSLSYVNGNLVYAATNAGKVYKLALSGATWTATVVSQAPLPVANITDLTALTATPATVVVVMNGFGHGHVWRGAVPGAGLATWTNLSGNLPDIPVNAIVIDPANANRLFAGTDIGVFETANGGTSWNSISASSTGLPNCAVFDLRLHEATRILRAATHGRGLWEKLVDAPSTPAVDIYVRDHLMDTARVSPTPCGVTATFDDPTRYVALGDPQYFWMCADIKIDALEGTVPSYQIPVAAVDYVAFEALQHRQPQRTKVNRVYVQLCNRGFQPATNVNVKILWADASAGLPLLPNDFWTAFPGNSTNTSQWRPVGAAQTIASFKPGKPVVLEWDWTPPQTAAEHSCMLVVMDSASDPIPAASKVFDVGVLIPTEKRVGLKNLHIIDALSAPDRGGAFATLRFATAVDKTRTIKLVPHSRPAAGVSLIFSKKAIVAESEVIWPEGKRARAGVSAGADGEVWREANRRLRHYPGIFADGAGQAWIVDRRARRSRRERHRRNCRCSQGRRRRRLLNCATGRRPNYWRQQLCAEESLIFLFDGRVPKFTDVDLSASWPGIARQIGRLSAERLLLGPELGQPAPLRNGSPGPICGLGRWTDGAAFFRRHYFASNCSNNSQQLRWLVILFKNWNPRRRASL